MEVADSVRYREAVARLKRLLYDTPSQPQPSSPLHHTGVEFEEGGGGEGGLGGGDGGLGGAWRWLLGLLRHQEELITQLEKENNFLKSEVVSVGEGIRRLGQENHNLNRRLAHSLSQALAEETQTESESGQSPDYTNTSLAAITRENQVLREEVGRLDAALSAMSGREQQALAKLSSALALAQDTHAHTVQVRASSESAVEELSILLTAAKQEGQQLRNLLDETDVKLRRQQEQQGTLSSQQEQSISSLKSESEELRAEVERLRRENEGAGRRVREMEGEVEAARTGRTRLEALLEEQRQHSQDAHQRLHHTLLMRDEEAAVARARTSELEERLQVARQDNTRLLNALTSLLQGGGVAGKPTEGSTDDIKSERLAAGQQISDVLAALQSRHEGEIAGLREAASDSSTAMDALRQEIEALRHQLTHDNQEYRSKLDEVTRGLAALSPLPTTTTDTITTSITTTTSDTDTTGACTTVAGVADVPTLTTVANVPCLPNDSQSKDENGPQNRDVDEHYENGGERGYQDGGEEKEENIEGINGEDNENDEKENLEEVNDEDNENDDKDDRDVDEHYENGGERGYQDAGEEKEENIEGINDEDNENDERENLEEVNDEDNENDDKDDRDVDEHYENGGERGYQDAGEEKEENIEGINGEENENYEKENLEEVNDEDNETDDKDDRDVDEHYENGGERGYQDAGEEEEENIEGINGEENENDEKENLEEVNDEDNENDNKENIEVMNDADIENDENENIEDKNADGIENDEKEKHDKEKDDKEEKEIDEREEIEEVKGNVNKDEDKNREEGTEEKEQKEHEQEQIQHENEENEEHVKPEMPQNSNTEEEKHELEDTEKAAGNPSRALATLSSGRQGAEEISNSGCSNCAALLHILDVVGGAVDNLQVDLGKQEGRLERTMQRSTQQCDNCLRYQFLLWAVYSRLDKVDKYTRLLGNRIDDLSRRVVSW